MSDQVESCAEIYVSVDAPKSTQEFEHVIETQEPTNPFEELDRHAIPEANPKIEDSKEDAQTRRTFKYKSACPKELIIGSKDSPL